MTDTETVLCATTLWFRVDGANMMRALGIKVGDSVLEFGCGPGRYVVPLSQVVGRNGRVFAIERDDDSIAKLHERLADLTDPSVVDIRQSSSIDVASMFNPNALDAVLLFDVLQYVEDWDALFLGLSRVLKPSGHIHIYPAALPHPGSVDINLATEKLSKIGFKCSGAGTFSMMHNVDRVIDTVYTFRSSL